MKYLKSLLLVPAILVSGLVFSGCSFANTFSPQPLPTDKSELSQPVPTADFKSTDNEDQRVIDELNQYQDESLDKDFNDLESQL